MFILLFFIVKILIIIFIGIPLALLAIGLSMFLLKYLFMLVVGVLVLPFIGMSQLAESTVGKLNLPINSRAKDVLYAFIFMGIYLLIGFIFHLI